MTSKKSNCTWLKRTVLSIALILSSLTAFSTASSSVHIKQQDDSLKCFTIEQSKTLLKYAEKGYMCDSLSKTYEKQIEALEGAIAIKDEQIALAGKMIQSQQNDISDLEKKVKIRTILLSCASGVATFQLLYILFKV